MDSDQVQQQVIQTLPYSQVGPYRILRTIGVGGSCKVKLGQHMETGQQVAIKILRQDLLATYEVYKDFFYNEIDKMRNLDHPNVLKLLDGDIDGLLIKRDGRQIKCIYMVLELAPAKELFDFIAIAGAFPESLARYFFRQIISALNYIHKSGIVHRDLKPQNILFDENFNIKICDFGFASPAGGKNNTGLCKTSLGTREYLAPEILKGQLYSGQSADLFGAAISLFLMIFRRAPFVSASSQDPFYKFIIQNCDEYFWKNHLRQLSADQQPSQNLLTLLTFMFQYEPSMRLSISEIQSNPWFIDTNTPSRQEVVQQFTQIRAQVEAIAEQNLLQDIQRYDQMQIQKASEALAFNGKRDRAGITRTATISDNEVKEMILTSSISYGNEHNNNEEMDDKSNGGVSSHRMTLRERRIQRQIQKQDKKNRGFDNLKRLDMYVQKVKRDTSFESPMAPDELFEELKEYMWLNNYKQNESSKKYRLIISIEEEDQLSEDNQEPAIALQFQVELLQMSEGVCVEFKRIIGDSFKFYELFNKMKEEMHELIQDY